MEKDRVFLMRCTVDDRRAIAALAAAQGVKQSEAVRRAVLLAAQVVTGQGANSAR